MARSDPIRVVHVGLGPIGQAVVRALADDARFAVVGAVDVDAAIVGRPLRDVVDGAKIENDVVVAATVADVLASTSAEVATQTTGSHLPAIRENLFEIIDAGLSLVSTAEELLYPWHRHPAIAAELQQRAVANKSRVLGTGVNPGFLMDLLPIVCAQASRRPSRIYAERVVDVTTRRGPLQRKVGSGLSVDEFRSRVEAGRMGHVGLQESAALLARKVGWSLATLEESIEPVIAERAIKTEHVSVEPGQAAGVHQVARGRTADGKTLELNLTMCMEAADPHDAVRIEGDPPLDVRLIGGCAGDSSTISNVLSCVPRLLFLPPGLWTVADLPASAIANP